MKVATVCERRVTVWTLSLVLLALYMLNSLWYVSNFVVDSPRRPLHFNAWWRFPAEAYNMSALNATTDPGLLVDRSDFQFLLNNPRCDGIDDLFLIVFIHSAPANFQKRRAIRDTWGNESNLVQDAMRLVFLLGEVSSPRLMAALAEENVLHRDLVQGNFLDSYRNLTYKHVMGLKWVCYHCRKARYIFKTDDDIFVDVLQLVPYLKGTFGVLPPRNLMVCYLIRNPYVKRSQRSKWRVSFREYPGKYYPPYCSGWGIIMSPDVVFNLYVQASRLPYFWVDDVHVSGILAGQLGIDHVDLTTKLSVTEADVRRWLTDKSLARPPLFGFPDSDVPTIYALWNKTVQYYNWTKSRS